MRLLRRELLLHLNAFVGVHAARHTSAVARFRRLVSGHQPPLSSSSRVCGSGVNLGFVECFLSLIHTGVHIHVLFVWATWAPQTPVSQTCAYPCPHTRGTYTHAHPPPLSEFFLSSLEPKT